MVHVSRFNVRHRKRMWMVRERRGRRGRHRPTPLAAGLRGMSSSSYIDAVILRDRFDVDDPEDPVHVDRHSMLANWRNDTVLVVSDGGIVLEFVQYTANGVPFGIPAGNPYSNGQNTVDDLTVLSDWHATGVYDARWDPNGDGKTDVLTLTDG